jgi:hypothetical protein
LRAGEEASLIAVETELRRIWNDGARRGVRWRLVVRAGRL